MAQKSPSWQFEDSSDRTATGTAQGVAEGDLAVQRDDGSLWVFRSSAWVAAIGAANALAAVLAVGNTTGGTDIEVTAGDDLVGGTAGTSDIGVVGGEFRDLHLTGAVDFAGASGLVSVAGIDRLRITATELEPVSAGLDLGAPGNEFGTIDQDGYLTQLERSSLGIAAAAGKGYWWVRDDAPSVPIFTDDAGTDHNLLAPGPTTDDWAAVLANGATSGGTSPTLSSGDDLLFAADNVSDIGDATNRAADIWLNGNVELGDGTTDPLIRISKTAGGTANIVWQDGSTLRWLENFNSSENLIFTAYNSSGVFVRSNLTLGSDGHNAINNTLGVGAPTLSGAPTGTRLALGDGSNASEYISFDVTAAGVGGILIGDSVDPDAGRWQYVLQAGASNDYWAMWNEGVEQLRWHPGEVRALVQYDVGTSAFPFYDAHFQRNVNVGDGSTAPVLSIDKLDAAVADISFRNAGVQRWRIRHESNEQLTLSRLNSSGVFVDSPTKWLTDGSVEFDNAVFVAGAPSGGYNPAADDIGVGDGTGSSGQSFLTSATGLATVAVRSPSNGLHGFWQFDTNNSRHTWGVNGSHLLRLDGNALEPWAAGGIDFGSATRPVDNLFLSDTLAFTGTSGTISVNGTDEVVLGTTATRPATNAGQALGTSFAGWGHLTLASVASAPSSAVARASIYSDANDNDYAKVIYGTGQTRRLHGAASTIGRLSLEDGAAATEIAVGLMNDKNNQFGHPKADIDDSSGIEDVIMVAPFDCYVYFTMRGEQSTSANGWGLTTVRLYTDRSTSTTRDSDTHTYSSDSTGFFDLSGYMVNEGDLISLTVQVSGNDGVGTWALHLEPA